MKKACARSVYNSETVNTKVVSVFVVKRYSPGLGPGSDGKKPSVGTAVVSTTA
jgi:hypothetical protein